MKKKNILFLISSTIAVIAMVLYIGKNGRSFKEILHISVFNFFVFTSLQIILLVVNGLVLRIYMDVFKKKISFLDSLNLTILNTFFNNIAVKSGALVKSYFLKKVHKLSYTDFILAAASFTLIEFIVAAAAGLLVITALYFVRGIFSIYIFLFFAAVSAASFMFFCLPFHNFIKPDKNWISQKLYDLSVSWGQISKNMPAMAKLFFLAFLNFVIFAARLSYGFHILYGASSFFDCLLASIVGILANLFAITPGALGVREFLIGAAYAAMKGNALHAVVVTVLDRVVSTAVVFLLSSGFIFYLLNKVRTRRNW